MPVRGTYCLWYQAHDAAEPCKPGEGYCSSCPLRDDESRRVLYADYWMDEARRQA